jgi:1-acyl-sn-glycerol-3-phosphate acyltransferase
MKDKSILFYPLLPLRIIWFIWILIWFFITGVFAFSIYLIVFNFFKGRNKILTTFYVTKWWGKILMAGMGIFVRARGTEKLDKKQTYVLVSNHLSMVDIPVCMGSCPVLFSFLAKKEVDKIPFVGYLARNMHVYVDRKSPESRVKSMENMRKHLDEKGSIHLFVEGTRNKGPEPLKKFHNGAFSLAIEAQKPIAVLVIIGSEKTINPNYSFQASPGLPIAVWTEPISTEGMGSGDVPKLSEMVRERMLTVLKEYGRA